MSADQARPGEQLVPCRDLDAEIARRRAEGFALDAILPADDPAVALMSREGERLRLHRADLSPAVRTNRIVATTTFTSAPAGDGDWHVGRAGMRYRDLIADRQGGGVIASHIAIPAGGEVPDSVHFHEIDFQLIFCAAGWVEVVYEDQGPPFVLAPGDCVLQPPTIRHRVLRSSPGLEVVELGRPAVHETRFDHDLELPTEALRPDRDFAGQHFVRHVAAGAPWVASPLDGFEVRQTDVGAASAGAGEVCVLRRHSGGRRTCSRGRSDDGVLTFWFVLAGSAVLAVDESDESDGSDGFDPRPFGAAASCTLAPATEYELSECSNDLEVLEVTLPIRPPG